MRIDGVRLYIGEGLCDNFTEEEYNDFIEVGYCLLEDDLEIPGVKKLDLRYYDTFTGIGCYHFEKPVEEDDLLMFFDEDELIPHREPSNNK
tara:strand:- start:4249 stop:4521 length:273 start_codon:yes stop_codon:yes gene_type:complete